MADKKTLKVTQTGSPIGRTDDQRATLNGLGLTSAIAAGVSRTRRRCAA